MDFNKADKLKRFAESCKKVGCDALIKPEDLLDILGLAALFELDYFRLHEITRLGSVEWRPCASGLQLESKKFKGEVFAGDSFREAIDQIPRAKPRKSIFNRPEA